MPDLPVNPMLACPFCLGIELTYVHGHGQCSRCGTNLEPCCEGSPPPDLSGVTLESQYQYISTTSHEN
jgi:hypothetical protein